MRTTQCFVRPMALLGAAAFLTAFACSTPMSSSSAAPRRQHVGRDHRERRAPSARRAQRRLARGPDDGHARLGARRGAHRGGDASHRPRAGRRQRLSSSAFRSRSSARAAAGPCCSTSFAAARHAARRPAAAVGQRRRRAARQRSRCCAIRPSLIDAHYDHLGIGRAVNGDSIYNGADDDASGVVAVLEIARALAAGPRPRRTVIFAATTGEEVGLLGTRWYHPASRRARRADEREPRDRDDRPPRFARGRPGARVAHGLRALDHGRDASRAPACRSAPTSGSTSSSSSGATTSRSRGSACRRTRCRRTTCTTDYHQPSDDSRTWTSRT